MVTSEDKHNNCPPSSFFFTAFIAEQDIILYGISLWSVEIICPSCVSFQPLVHPQPPHISVRNRKDLDVAQALLSNNKNTSVLSTFHSNVFSYGLVRRKLIPSQLKTVQYTRMWTWSSPEVSTTRLSYIWFVIYMNVFNLIFNTMPSRVSDSTDFGLYRSFMFA